ncbi:FAD-binding oxidoreductase [Cryobacterium sp. 1639]|uniref:FAD-binding oxidoreductase n=1 Tax=Cryobacterium inferilacus TaxID=2866629 RepID=UPI001C7308E9|nr:FAD-binding oxidoreductase [Cryobacterium sp. 1639]MBX0299051.1 FAD-binding oxidoreductase [Cryobacterium sp. 1639]
MIDGFAGSILLPDSAEYPAAATAYGVLGSPALVARPSSAADVAAAIGYARAHGLPLSVRSGGHTLFSTNDGGMVLDLAGISDVEVLGDGLVRVGGGAVWGDVARALQPHGLAISSGDTYSVGVGGLTLGGGIGWMVRQQGLALDSLREAEVVLPSGAVVTASGTREPELFWALRGGGGNFGVVTRFTFQAHPLPGVVAGSITVDPARLADTLRGWRDVMRHSPEELNSTVIAMPAFGPEMPAATQVLVCFGGNDVDEAMTAIQPLLTLPGVTGHDVAAKAYVDVLEEPELPPAQIRLVDHNGFARNVDDGLISRLTTAHAAFGAAVLMVRYLRGAFNRVPADATALAYRDAEAFVVSAAFLPPDAPADAERRIHDGWAALAGDVTGEYGNFSMHPDATTITRIYPPATVERLRAAKRRYDPENVLAFNHNIVP